MSAPQGNKTYQDCIDLMDKVLPSIHLLPEEEKKQFLSMIHTYKDTIDQIQKLNDSFMGTIDNMNKFIKDITQSIEKNISKELFDEVIAPSADKINSKLCKFRRIQMGTKTVDIIESINCIISELNIKYNYVLNAFLFQNNEKILITFYEELNHNISLMVDPYIEFQQWKPPTALTRKKIIRDLVYKTRQSCLEDHNKSLQVEYNIAQSNTSKATSKITMYFTIINDIIPLFIGCRINIASIFNGNGVGFHAILKALICLGVNINGIITSDIGRYDTYKYPIRNTKSFIGPVANLGADKFIFKDQIPGDVFIFSILDAEPDNSNDLRTIHMIIKNLTRLPGSRYFIILGGEIGFACYNANIISYLLSVSTIILHKLVYREESSAVYRDILLVDITNPITPEAKMEDLLSFESSIFMENIEKIDHSDKNDLPVCTTNTTHKSINHMLKDKFGQSRLDAAEEKFCYPPTCINIEKSKCQVCHIGRGAISGLLICKNCKKAYYCSVTCQKADWRTHKQSCLLENSKK